MVWLPGCVDSLGLAFGSESLEATAAALSGSSWKRTLLDGRLVLLATELSLPAIERGTAGAGAGVRALVSPPRATDEGAWTGGVLVGEMLLTTISWTNK